MELAGVPVADPGSPEVALFATDHRVALVYSVPGLQLGQVGPSGRILLPEDIPAGYDPIALVEFLGPHAHLFGPPNDEAFEGHPLASRGLQPYGAYEVEHSSWIRTLEKMNRVHPRHDPRSYEALRHFVIAFHDSTFECIASGIDGKRYERDVPEFVNALRDMSRLRGESG